MANTTRNQYRPHANLAARRHDPERRRQALADAFAVAHFLKEETGARVYGIGSLFDPDRPFGSLSDIDLVVEGVPKRDYFDVSGRAQELTDITLDIIPLEDANDLIREIVRERGVPL